MINSKSNNVSLVKEIEDLSAEIKQIESRLEKASEPSVVLFLQSMLVYNEEMLLKVRAFLLENNG